MLKFESRRFPFPEVAPFKLLDVNPATFPQGIAFEPLIPSPGVTSPRVKLRIRGYFDVSRGVSRPLSQEPPPPLLRHFFLSCPFAQEGAKQGRPRRRGRPVYFQPLRVLALRSNAPLNRVHQYKPSPRPSFGPTRDKITFYSRSTKGNVFTPQRLFPSKGGAGKAFLKRPKSSWRREGWEEWKRPNGEATEEKAASPLVLTPPSPSPLSLVPSPERRLYFWLNSPSPDEKPPSPLKSNV